MHFITYEKANAARWVVCFLLYFPHVQLHLRPIA